MPVTTMYGDEAVLDSLDQLVRSTPITVKTPGGANIALYTDITGGTGGTGAPYNPVSTDANGNLRFFSAPGVYDLWVAGVKVNTIAVGPLPHAASHAIGGTDPVPGTGSVFIAAPTGVAATDTAVLNAAYGALPAGGGTIRCQPGTYEINATVTQVVANSILDGTGAKIHTSSAIRMFDSGGLDGMQFKNVTIDGGGVATNLWHPYVSASIGQHFRTDHVRFINGTSTATLVDTIGGVGWSIADCRFYDTDFVTGGIGITLGDYDNQFFGCTWGALAVGGVKFVAGRSGSGGSFFGCIWSGNKVDLLLNVVVGPLSFFGCWFENSSQAVLALSTSLAQAGQLHFYNCNLATSTGAGLFLFDLTNASLGTIDCWGGTWNPSYPAALKVPTNCTVLARSVVNASLYALTGAGYFIRENSPADQLYPGRELFSGHFAVATAGYGLRVAEGSNAKQGLSAAMVAGAVTVANTSITATSRLQLTRQAGGTNPGAVFESARTAGTSFTVTSTNGADTGTVAFQIFEPA